MNVLSVFDGISAGRLALGRAGVEVGTYYRSEIDKFANQVAIHHFPGDIQLGDITKWREWDLDWSAIDLFIGGSPCQGFSFAGKQAGTKCIYEGVEFLITDRSLYKTYKKLGAEFLSQSHLFWEYVLILDHIRAHNPNVKFLLENVKMKKELLQMISDALGVNDVVINSSLVSAQNRHRHYWCNWEVTQPEDKGILLRDILGEGTLIEQRHRGKNKGGIHTEKSTTVTSNSWEHNHRIMKVGNVNPSGNGMNGNVYHVDAKSPTLTTNKGEGIKITGGAIRGRYIVDGKRQDHKMKTAGLTEQRLEIRSDGKTNTLTTVQKDNVVVYREPLYPEATAENKKNEAAFIECSGMNETATKEGKSYCLTANCGGAWAKHSATKKVRTMAAVGFTQDGNVMTSHNQIKYRKLTPTECARLQTFPDGWCESVVSKSQAYKAYGNSWTVDVIAHIFKGLKNESI